MPTIRKQPSSTPLAAILRPSRLSEVLGQDHLLGPGRPLSQMVARHKFTSIIFWGPPGVGKTSIVRALAADGNAVFRQLNATDATVKQLRTIIKAAADLLPEQRTFVFVDECHRWNKAQQDVLLPVVEDGTIILFGATTERPKFAVNSTLLSRCLVYEVKPLNDEAALKLILRIRQHYKDAGREVRITKEAARNIINRCSGDARKIITVLETAIEILSDDNVVDVAHIDVAMPDKHLVFDARGNDHFDLAHCYQEAIQHSDVDGAIYWLAKWIASGEDPAYICRRMMITAFEDCAGNPFAPMVAMAACYATERTGLPECMIPMALATCEMATSRRNKSAYFAIKEAMQDVENGATVHVPSEMRAGTAGYLYGIAKSYLKGWTRDWDPIVKHDDTLKDSIVYGLGIEHKPDEFGMYDGPTPDLNRLLTTIGRKGACVVQFKPGGDNGPITDVLYRWDDVECEWFKLN